MSFLVPGGPGVRLGDPATYSMIMKQLNQNEIQMLPALMNTLVPRYLEPEGSMLARFLGWVRYPAEGIAKFDGIIMENLARPPPGGNASAPSGSSAGGGSPWKPFDMKGIRMYKHEARFLDAFGARGLAVSAAHADAYGTALRHDLDFLTSNDLVDYSFLMHVFPSGAAPRRCDAMRRDADFAPATDPTPASRLLPAFYRLRRSAGGGDAAAADGSDGGDGGDDDDAGMCASVVVRIAIIDYLREWKLYEQMEHLRKSITRDLVRAQPPGANHAVVPVSAFAERIDAFFHEALFGAAPRPEQPTVASLAREVVRSATAAFRQLHRVPVHIRVGAGRIRLGGSPSVWWQQVLRRGAKGTPPPE